MENRKTILLLDNDAQSASHIQKILAETDSNLAITHTSDIGEGLSFLQAQRTDLVLLDENILVKPDFNAIRNLLTENNTPYLLLSDLSLRAEGNTGGKASIASSKLNTTYLRSAVANTFKLAEAEDKLKRVFEEYSGRIESFSLMLDMLQEAVLVINKAGDIYYSNAKAYAMLAEEELKQKIAFYLAYHNRETEEAIELKNGKYDLNIRINNFVWNGEETNIFLIGQNKSAGVAHPVTGVYQMATALLNTIEGNILLLKNDMIEFANLNATKELSFAETVTGQPVYDIFQINNGPINNASIKQADGSFKQIQYTLRDLVIGEEAYQVFSFRTARQRELENNSYRLEQEQSFAHETVANTNYTLQDPVAIVLEYIRLISDHQSKGEYKQANEQNSFAKQAITRVEQILPDVKAYLELNVHDLKIENSAVKAVAEEAITTLRSQIDALGAELNVSELPKAKADKVLLNTVFTQLIGNALKFSKKNRKPVIDIGYDVTDGHVIFCVRDNGIGISKKDHKRVFELFEKLDNEEEHTGNGFGLALCKKMVEMQGGEIWVEGLPGLGSNFYFTLKNAAK